MYLALEGHPSGIIIFIILFYYVSIAVLLIVISLLISAIDKLRETDRSDSERLKACKKKIIFRSIITVLLLIFAFINFLV